MGRRRETGRKGAIHEGTKKSDPRSYTKDHEDTLRTTEFLGTDLVIVVSPHLSPGGATIGQKRAFLGEAGP